MITLLTVPTDCTYIRQDANMLSHPNHSLLPRLAAITGSLFTSRTCMLGR